MQEQPPNILFILIDDLGAVDLASFGSSFYATPNLDRLAERGLVFTDAYASCPVCSPTRGSLLTGRYPARMGLTDWIRLRGPHPARARASWWTCPTSGNCRAPRSPPPHC